MKIGDILYFAPNVKFSELDLSGQKLSEQFDSRIRGFYLEPVKSLAQNGHAFASGLVLVSCIDALSRLQSKSKASVRCRFCAWVKNELPSFGSPAIAGRFYDEFRNGLVHEARVKKGGQFSLEQSSTVDTASGVLSVNPMRLADEVSVALHRYVATLKGQPNACRDLLARLKTDFQYELTP